MKFTGWFSIVVGVLMLVQWTFFISAGQVPELQTQPVAIALHLAAEAITALALIVSGAALLRQQSWAKTASFFALGMLTYTVIVSPGYFAQQGVWPPVIMFAVILIMVVVGMRALALSK